MSKQFYGWRGKILRVDLSNGSITTEPTEKYLDRFLGGKSINQAILFDEVPDGVDPYDPDNRVIIGAGTLGGTLAPSTGRVSIDCKNAFTHGISSSNAGGHFAPELKFAGYDNIVIHGKSEKPVYLWIMNDKVELRDASPIWGRTVLETEAWIKDDVGDNRIHTALIGPAGENLVRGACVMIDRTRAAARGGHGAVLGSKNFKGVAVRGTGSVKIAEPDRFLAAVESALQRLMDSNFPTGFQHRGGTHLVGSTPCNEASIISVRNVQDGFWERDRLGKVDYPIFEEKYEKRRVANFACPIYCGHIYELKEGPYAPVVNEGMEANTVWAAARLDIDHAPWLPAFHTKLSQYGLDNDFASNIIGWIMELYEEGIVTSKDLDGIDPTWGNHQASMELLDRIVFREGIGDILAEGVFRASKSIGKGSDWYAIHMKGNDMIEEFRATIGWGLGTTTALTGGGHLDGAVLPETDGTPDFLAKELFDATTFDPLVYDGKEKIVIWQERYKQIVDSVGMCYFASSWVATGQRIGYPEISELVSAATGKEYSPEELQEIGTRTWNVSKAFNTLHAGFTRSADLPPRRFFEDPIKTGPFAGSKLDPEKWDKLLDDYYEFQGWDKEKGWQTREILENLDLKYVADRLEENGKLA